ASPEVKSAQVPQTAKRQSKPAETSTPPREAQAPALPTEANTPPDAAAAAASPPPPAAFAQSADAAAPAHPSAPPVESAKASQRAPTADADRPLPNPNAVVVVGVQQSGQTMRVEFPFAVATPAAVFQRADTLWLVFDTPTQIDLSAIQADNDN